MKNTHLAFVALLLSMISLSGWANNPSNLSVANPVTVKGTDLIEKVYGVINPNSSEAECREGVRGYFTLTPTEEDGSEWLSSDNGFYLTYQGITPEADAMARYEKGEIAGYGYIFYFPYEAEGRRSANDCQCEFCSALLQELADNGMTLGADQNTDALFHVRGESALSDFDVVLREEIEHETVTTELAAGEIPADRKGCFVLMISVEPSNVTLTACR